MDYFCYAKEFVKLPSALIRSQSWNDYSRLIIRGDSSGWVLDEFAKELGAMVEVLGAESVSSEYYKACRSQVVFFTSKYFLLKWRKSSHRITFPYFHGDPRVDPSNASLFKSVVSWKDDISRIQVSHKQLEHLFLDSGLSREKVHRIPIAINLDLFSLRTREVRARARTKLGIPKSAVVIGSFQKDGIGFKLGKEPKLIKGPDTLLEVAQILAGRIEGLYFLLTGPARGYVKTGLTKIGVPYIHVDHKDYKDIEQNFHAIDAYVVTSREEGGPRAILESMATGVPIISTRVGQALDLIVHGENGWLSDVGDVEALAHWVEVALEKDYFSSKMSSVARSTAEKNSWIAQTDLWRWFFDGILEIGNTN